MKVIVLINYGTVGYPAYVPKYSIKEMHNLQYFDYLGEGMWGLPWGGQYNDPSYFTDPSHVWCGMKTWTQGKIYVQLDRNNIIAITKAVEFSSIGRFLGNQFVGIELWYFRGDLGDYGEETPYCWNETYQMVLAPSLILAMYGITL